MSQATRPQLTGRRPNILFSTTRSWNPGDDFILYGIRHLLEPLVGAFNSIIYNRNPDLHTGRRQDLGLTLQVDGKDAVASAATVCEPFVWKADNSWREPKHLQNVDLVIFAGTPEWASVMVEPLVNALLGVPEIPVIYLGIGSFEALNARTFDSLSARDRELLARAQLITVRDAGCARLLEHLEPHYLPCPALFCSSHETHRSGFKRIALSMQGRSTESRQPIPDAKWRFCVELLNTLSSVYECIHVCHYVDEITSLRPHLCREIEFFYSYDPLDYAGVYDACDLTVTTRIHGAGLCASLGIPSLLIQHSARTGTAEGFLSQVIDPESSTVESVIDRLARFDVSSASATLLKHKASARQKYTNLLRPALEKCGLLCNA